MPVKTDAAELRVAAAFAAMLEAARREQQMSFGQLGDISGIGATNARRYCLGLSEPSVSRALRMMAALDIRPAALGKLSEKSFPNIGRSA